MAEKYAREQKNYKWNIIAGVSVGALNGVMIASEQYQRLEQIWNTISNDQVYTGGLNYWSVMKIIFGAKSFYDNDPLRRMIELEIDPSKIKTILKIGYVSLLSGEYLIADPTQHPYVDNPLLFKQAVLASTVMPIIWTPENNPPYFRAAIDGG
ncbi:MAG: patatin-like phospholipase family protein [Bacteroidetes bacterium]|nr:patatin-like phospholipase family protein [Bacteroidota bacterium]